MLRTGFIGAGRRASSAHYPSLHRIEEVSLELGPETIKGLLKVTEGPILGGGEITGQLAARTKWAGVKLANFMAGSKIY